MPASDTTKETPSGQAHGQIARLGALVVAKAPQIVGLYLAIREAGRAERDEAMILLIALCIMGVQAAQEIAFRIIDRVFGERQP